MSNYVTITQEGATVFGAPIRSGMIMFRNDITDTAGMMVRVTDQTELFNLFPLLSLLRDRAREKCKDFRNVETPSTTFKNAELTLTVTANNQPLMQGQEHSKIAMVAIETTGVDTIVPRILTVNIETYEDWAYVYSMCEKYLAEYKEKLRTHVQEVSPSKGGRLTKADDIEI